PPVTFDFRRFTLEQSVEDLLLTLRPQTVPVYFPGSRWNHQNVGPQQSIIGGVLRWNPTQEGSSLEAGWTHELHLAPTLGVVATLTVGQLVTNPSPTMGDFDPAITIADLGNVTIGLS